MKGEPEMVQGSELRALPNIGEKLETQLKDADIQTAEELADVGSREAWIRILMRDPSACYHRLCALEGAIQGIRWHDLSPQDKASLKAFFQEHKS